MFENLNDFIFKVAIMFFFIIGITLFLISQEKTGELIDLAQASYLQSDSIAVQDQEKEDYYVLGDEIIAQKISFNGVPIVVEGVTIEKIEDLLIIEMEEKYTKRLILNETGQLNYVEYRKK